MSEVAAVYGDGGVIRVNPSPIGGTWAMCHVDADGWRVHQASGLIVPSEVDGAPVTNNQTEFYALLSALEALPDGWSGKVCTDSLVTIRRFKDPENAGLRGIPLVWRKRQAMTLGRMGTLEYVRLDGHPTKAHLKAGVGKRGGPVSEFNVWCDKECGRVAERSLLAMGRLG